MCRLSAALAGSSPLPGSSFALKTLSELHLGAGKRQERYAWDGAHIRPITHDLVDGRSRRRDELQATFQRLKARSWLSQHIQAACNLPPALTILSEPVGDFVDSFSCSLTRALWLFWRATCAGAAQDSLFTAFFPKPTEVTPDYWQYTQWRSAHRLFSAVLHNFSTQARGPLADDGAADMTCGTMIRVHSGPHTGSVLRDESLAITCCRALPAMRPEGHPGIRLSRNSAPLNTAADKTRQEEYIIPVSLADPVVDPSSEPTVYNHSCLHTRVWHPATDLPALNCCTIWCANHHDPAGLLQGPSPQAQASSGCCGCVQSLLTAVGVGGSSKLPTAAAINWVLKDGLGRLGRLTVATSFGESFDSDLKVSSPSSCFLGPSQGGHTTNGGGVGGSPCDGCVITVAPARGLLPPAPALPGRGSPKP